MNRNDERLREVLARIAELASEAANGGGGWSGRDEEDQDEGFEEAAPDNPGCVLKSLPKRLLVRAAEVATRINPVNAPLTAAASMASFGVPPTRAELAVITQKYWGPKPRTLSVSFVESTPANLRSRIVANLNAWTKSGCITFAETKGTGDVRISRAGSGYWSYLGTDIRLIPKHQPTMNLQSFTMSTPESEYKRVVRHEAGHTLGFPHEHMRKALVARIDRTKAYAYFLATYGWNKQQVDEQVLTPLDEKTLIRTPADQTSIMCYQLPGSITKDGKPILGGRDINATDYAFVAEIYPKAGGAQGMNEAEDWDESDDVYEAAE